jgi:hypothetical protein
MTSAQFLQWLEDGLRAAGARKMVPDEGTLASAYAYQKKVQVLQKAHDRALREFDSRDLPMPPDLERRVRERITDTALSWDEGLWQIIGEDEGIALHEKTTEQDDGSDEETRGNA